MPKILGEEKYIQIPEKSPVKKITNPGIKNKNRGEYKSINRICL